MLEYCPVFAKQTKPLPPELELPDFYHLSEPQKMAKYYLLQWVQALQHMPYTSTLNKCLTKRNYIKHIINLIAFGLVETQ